MNFDSIDLNLLRVFDVLMRERNVTVTADRLCRTQSAISHSLAKLRSLFNDELFVRDGGTMKPTPRAIELAVDISTALSSIRATVDRHQRFDPSQTRANFRVGLIDYHAMIFLPNLIKELAEKAPNATLNVIPAARTEVAPLIHSHQLDCAIMGNFDVEDPGLLKLELGQDRLVCAMWRGSSLLQQPLTLESYLAATHVQISADGMSESLADRALKERGLRRKVAATIPNYLIIPWVLRGTDLITHCGDSILLLLDEKSEVMLAPPPLPLPPLTISLVLHRQMATDPATTWFRGIIERIFEEWQASKKSAWAESPFVC
ncbi:Nodulation protein D 2 [Variovorax boronicumulans]|uniref:LysR family transcriptional regulator n=1 Tax=Variovorax boronicumulans TaxID=436515 RepID=UPI000BB3D01C|nr:LysR family transcriptional regulator [Variovorax boronicumulans]PBI87740.1 Nodulation protein D 2 [Variovorax boronicumulans]